MHQVSPSAATSAPVIAHRIAGQSAAIVGRQILVTSPINGRILGAIQVADAAVVNRAVTTASAAASEWGRLPIKERVQPLFRFKHLAEQHIVDLSTLASNESGKTIAEAEAGIRKGLEVVEYACSLPAVMTGGMQEVSNGVDCHARQVPLGVVAGITPFNFPAMVPLWMIPIAIAMGNAFILKPSEQVPLTATRIADLFADAGLLPGVLSVVHGDRETAEALLDHRGIAALGFVGSTPIAREVFRRGTASDKRMLALGGAKNHLVVLPDAEIDMTAKGVVASAFGCAGQRCMAASALIAVGDCDHLLDAIEAETRKVRLGTDMGAIINRRALERIRGYVDRAASGGARLRLDGRTGTVAGSEGGNWFGPTIIDGLSARHECLVEEIFGPVLAITRVRTLDEALAIQNASRFGNAASLFTSSGAAAQIFEARANAGMIGINVGVPVPREPFSFGGWNESKFGVGDITGDDGARFWSKQRKTTRKWSARDRAGWMS